MDCSALQGLLPMIVTGRLSATASDHVVVHLRGCPRCAERVDRARGGQRTPTDRVPLFEAPPAHASDHDISRTYADAAPGGTVKYGSDTGAVETDPVPGSTMGGYVIIDEIARGGMGIVYRANQKHMNRVVALKVLPRQALNDEELVLRFIREARAAAELNHPNVVRVYDIGRDQGLIWFSMELVEGRSLRDIIKAEGRLPPKKAVEVVLGCAKALEAAEAHQIVHRDVKPDNLLIAPDGTVKLADLGLVRHEWQRGTGDLTREGDLLGTPSYMSPEQARDSRDADNKSDLWSLGATLYHALFGVPPFLAKTAMETISRVLKDEVKWPAETDALPRELRAVVKKLLQKEPRDRFQTATDLVKALERAKIEIEQRRSSQRALMTGSERARLAAAVPKVHRATSSAEHPAARPRRRKASRPARLLPVAVLIGAAGIAGPFLIFSQSRKSGADDKLLAPTSAAIPTPLPAARLAPVASSARPAPDPVKRPVKDEEPPPNEELPVVVTAPTAAEGPPTSGIAGALKNKEELDALRALVSSTDVLLLARALSRAEKLSEDADATSLRAQLAEQLARVSEVHRELEVEEEVAKALGPLRRGQPNGFEAARQACTHTIARLDSRVAVEMTDAANLSEELLARARKGLAVDATEPVLLKNKMSFTGASTPSGDLWKAGNVYFSFPGDVSIEGLRVLASRTERSLPQLARAAAGWALLSNDLNDARKRLIAVARAEKKPVFERLEEVLRNRERNLRLPVLAHADLAWGAGQRSSAMQLYHRLCTTPPDVLAPDDRQRALERAGLVKPAPTTVAAPAGKRAWDFTKIKERTDGLPADWTRASAVSLDAFPGRPRAAARLETFDSEQTPEGLELTGVGRIVSSPTWTQSELQIDVEANLSETMGLGITLGDYAEAGDTVWTIAGYGIRFAPRGRLARFDPQAFFARQDGLWVTTTGLPQITPLKNVEPKAPEDERGGKVALRLTATRKDGKLRLVFARLVDAKPQTIAEGTLTEHLPAARTPLRAGLVVTGWGDQETVVVERFSVTPR